ncbi:ABC transporter substrate-binding protein [Brevibacillus borstelensis]|jgi:peptide/nickel transport system substrate-binding protein|uniref:ABC transporter substrate-binding protein n=1 Tax=Brevibacillus TaxID=55080 RepID=UPI001FAA2EE3|nr:ABC transporter substrate-binding protein [Brevibacillus borstelensis]MCM3561593.1 ABC transporter substrate-binding protein [Brevibacillus borstelensis]MCM3593663.1 ABC transporter substrate-binding protein [Brevibacillus borstelensis]MCM3625435.1 ABC transporter substrate-binding protein [Brevibacillus borstelensis]
MLGKWYAKPIAAIMAMVLLLAAGCAPDKNQGTGAEAEKKKDELILAIGYEPEDGFDPTTGWGRYGSPLFQSTLLKRGKDLKIVNDLATGYEVSDDGLVWTVKLRSDVKFSDGQPLTADDVAYTYDTASKSGSVIDLTVLKSVEAVDPFTVKFTLVHPQSTFVNILVATGIVPKHAHGEDYAKKPIGSGPYKLVQWDAGQQLIVEANPEYYGPKSAFKKLTFLFLKEDAAYAAAKAGEVDMAFVLPNAAKQQVPGMHLVTVNSVDNRGILFPVVKAGGATKDGAPVGNDVTADIAIRKAINIAIDRKKLVEGIFDGFGTPAYSVADGMPWWNPDTVIEDADFDQAGKILAAADWKDADGDGILEKGSLKAEFTLVYQADDQSRQSLAIAAADMIRPLGINIKVVGGSWDDIARMMHSNAVLFGWGSYDPLEMYNLYSSKTAGIGWYNTGFYANPAVDEYMEKALKATTEEEALGYWKKAQWDGKTGFSAKGDAPWAWLVNRQHLYLVRDGLDIGQPKIQPHGHGWPITDNIVEWSWKK